MENCPSGKEKEMQHRKLPWENCQLENCYTENYSTFRKVGPLVISPNKIAAHGKLSSEKKTLKEMYYSNNLASRECD